MIFLCFLEFIISRNVRITSLKFTLNRGEGKICRSVLAKLGTFFSLYTVN